MGSLLQFVDYASLMAGYSGTPLARKFGIVPGARVLLVAAPAGFEGAIDGLPPGVSFLDHEARDIDVAILFVTERTALQARFAAIAAALRPAGGLWIAWPKRASRVPTDITEDVLREVILPSGLVDNKVCAIDETRSGLRFVRRLKDRPK